MTAILKASNWLNGQLNSIYVLDSRYAFCMEYHVCTSLMYDFANLCNFYLNIAHYVVFLLGNHLVMPL